jgi:hypothetical protein
MRRLRTTRGIVALTLSATAVLAVSVFTAPAEAGGPPRYRVTIRALVPGQPLTPPVVVAHRFAFDLFEVGDLASVGIKEVAENGNVPNLVSSVEQAFAVRKVVAGAEPLVADGVPGAAMFDDRVTLRLTAPGGARFFSWASMLICTNDGFTGANHVLLPKDVGDRVRVASLGYDAGTEVNTEDFADIVPPCQDLVGVSSADAGTGVSDAALLEGGVIHHHGGIAGGEDLVPAAHGWDTDRPVAMITVTRIA